MKKILKKHADKIRFGIVGAVNTSIDFCLLFFLVYLGLTPILGNIISTSTALIFSFLANKKFTFKDIANDSKRQFTYFLTITLFGLWLIQPVVIWLVAISLEQITNNNYLVLLVGKTIATIASLIWNYWMYKKFVFKGVL